MDQVTETMRATETRHGDWSSAMTMGQAGIWAWDVLELGLELLLGQSVWDGPWVSAGTALGLYRDDRLIPHDTDLDVEVAGFWGDPFEPDLPDSFELVRSLDFEGHPMQRAYLCGGVIFDVYFFWVGRPGELMADLLNVNDSGVIRLPGEFVGTLRTVVRDGWMFPFPAPPEGYLEWRYGPDWRTPTGHKRPWAEDAACLEDS